MRPLVSIIIPVYNVEQYLSQCLDSIINQTLKELEIICVNDGSKDQSLKILQEYALKDRRITVIDQPNSGVSIARNKALKQVSGQYYMFLDSDDWLDINTCNTIYNLASQHNADCLMFSYTKEFGGHNITNHIFENDFFVWDTDDVKKNFHRRLFGPIGTELTKPQNIDITVSPCMQLFRTDKFKNIQFEDIRKVGTFEDGLYQMVLYKECNKFVYINKPFYHYRKTNNRSITTQYQADLCDKWQHLYDIIQSYINVWNLNADYHEAFRNRIAMGIIGLGLNQTHSNNSIWKGSIILKEILKMPRYSDALSQLDISLMPISWKVFFFLAKYRLTIPLFVMLKIIEYCRTHTK